MKNTVEVSTHPLIIKLTAVQPPLFEVAKNIWHEPSHHFLETHHHVLLLFMPLWLYQCLSSCLIDSQALGQAVQAAVSIHQPVWYSPALLRR